jgi:hypothetical protein
LRPHPKSNGFPGNCKPFSSLPARLFVANYSGMTDKKRWFLYTAASALFALFATRDVMKGDILFLMLDGLLAVLYYNQAKGLE